MEYSGYPVDEFETLYNEVSRLFSIIDYYQYNGSYVFKVEYDENLKTKFNKLRENLKIIGYIPLMDKEEEHLKITIYKFGETKAGGERRALYLFLATLATILIDGYIRSSAPFYYDVIRGYNPWIMTILYTISLLAIIGIHELGHKIVLSYYKIEASLPNFIPGIPGFLPTFGAVISQREVPANRDILFDTGISGPIAGLIATILVSIYSALTAPIITMETYKMLELKYGPGTPFPVPPIYSFILHLVRNVPEGDYVIIVTPLVWAAVVGFLITGLNLLPAWQLDGGHMARAVVGEKYHSILTIISIGILMVTGYMLMGFLVLILYFLSGGRGVRPLDDVSGITLWRKILFIIFFGLAFLCLPIQFPLPQI